MNGTFILRRAFGPPPRALRWVALLVVPLFLLGLLTTGQRALENYRLNQEAETLRGEIAILRADNLRLQQDIEQARTDVAIETIAREQLGLIKPGDHPLVIVQSGAAPAATPAPAPSPPPRPIWRQWYDYFFG